jgi:hypothetical protein
MGNNYDFRFNPKRPSTEEITRHKNFDRLLTRFRQEQGLRSKRLQRIRRLYIGSAAAAAVVALVVIGGGIFTSPQDQQLSPTAYFEQRAFINQPIPEIASQTDVSSFTVDVNQGGVYEYPSGSRLVIPAAAFADDYGNLIEGEVDIFYKEKYDYVDFFLSGIPLKYDSAQHRYQLESAGIIEIYAEKNGRPVQIAPNKNIEVELVSEVYLNDLSTSASPEYYVYQLDTFNRAWSYYATNEMELVGDLILDSKDPLLKYKQELVSRLKDIETRLAVDQAALEHQYPRPVAPIRPQVADGNRPTLELDFLNGDLSIEDNSNGVVQSELAKLQRDYEGVIWQISPNSPAYDERAFGVEWEAIKVRPTNNNDYELTLIHPQNQLTLIVTPVLVGSDYEQAIDQYEIAKADYEQQLEARNSQIQAQSIALKNSVDAQKSAIIDAYNSQLQALKTSGVRFLAGESLLAKRKAISRFMVSNLGIWNCARPIQVEGQPIRTAFKDQYGEVYRNHTLYVAEKGSNTLYQYYANGDSEIVLSPEKTYLMWIVTDDNKIASVNPSMQNWQHTDESEVSSYTFQLQLSPSAASDAEALRQLLDF